MLLYIHDNKRVEDLQERFNDCFPYLKMQFYKPAARSEAEFDKTHIIKGVLPVGAIRRRKHCGVLDIKSWYTTGRVKKDLKEQFGLNVQIFRLHKDQWIRTSYSDELTLKQQGELAQSWRMLSP